MFKPHKFNTDIIMKDKCAQTVLIALWKKNRYL